MDKLLETLSACRNWFDKESEKVIGEAAALENIIITIEKRFNVDKVDFKYDPEKAKFIRLTLFEKAEQYQGHEQCKNCSTPCFKDEYTLEEFIATCESGAFELIKARAA